MLSRKSVPYNLIKDDVVMKKILSIITLLFLFTLTTSKASAMSLQMHDHQNNSHFIHNHVISNMQNHHSSQTVKSNNDSTTTQVKEQTTQENSTSAQSYEQISNSTSQSHSEVFDAFMYVMLSIAFALVIVRIFD